MFFNIHKHKSVQFKISWWYLKKCYHKTGKYGNTRLDGILAYLFLKAVNLMVSDEQVAKATTKNFRHKTVKSKFINIFPDILYVPTSELNDLHTQSEAKYHIQNDTLEEMPVLSSDYDETINTEYYNNIFLNRSKDNRYRIQSKFILANSSRLQ